MKKIVLLLIVAISMCGCIVMPSRLSIHEKRLWIHQNQPRQYYYKTHPRFQERIKRGKIYTPYFRPGRY